MKRIQVNSYVRQGLYGLTALILVGSLLFIGLTIKGGKNTEIKENALSYKNNATVNYTVSLLPNSIYDEKVLGEGKTYLSEYIEQINTKLKYNFQVDKAVQGKGTYEVIATVNGNLGSDKELKEVWSKKYVLQPKTEFSFSDTKGEILKDLPVNFRDYNKLVQEVNKNLGINFNGKLNIQWNININCKFNGEDIVESLSPKMEIPLNEKYFNVGGSLVENKEGAIEETRIVTKESYSRNLILGVLGIAVSLVGFAGITLFTERMKNASKYVEKINKILKGYGERLVALKDEPVNEGKEIIRVLKMEDLVKIADDLDKPILYKHSSEIEDIRSFYILEREKAYVFYPI